MCLIIFKVPLKDISSANGETVLSVTAKCSSNVPTKVTCHSSLQALIWILTDTGRHSQIGQIGAISILVTNNCNLLLVVFLSFLFPFPSQIPLAIIWLSPISLHRNKAYWLICSGEDNWSREWAWTEMSFLSGPDCIVAGKKFVIFFPNAIITLKLARNPWQGFSECQRAYLSISFSLALFSLLPHLCVII